jgi:hypothetical protein
MRKTTGNQPPERWHRTDQLHRPQSQVVGALRVKAEEQRAENGLVHA